MKFYDIQVEIISKLVRFYDFWGTSSDAAKIKPSQTRRSATRIYNTTNYTTHRLLTAYFSEAITMFTLFWKYSWSQMLWRVTDLPNDAKETLLMAGIKARELKLKLKFGRKRKDRWDSRSVKFTYSWETV